jgi:hypothetical protein
MEEMIMGATLSVEELAKQKLEAFERLQPEFEASFHFVQDVHGQRRFSAFPVAETVHYLHALWICECKDRLLSIYKNIERYEGRYCLELLRRWQEGESADVVAFLQRKLDGLPFAELTRQIEEAKAAPYADAGLTRRLIHGRLNLLNRSMNLMQALNAIFSFPEDDLRTEVQVACAHYGHHPGQIEQQLEEIENPLYSYMPHRLLAQRNMLVMNKSGVKVMMLPADPPEANSEKVATPLERVQPFAEQLIEGYLELVSPSHNNLMRHRFVDRPEVGEGFRV